MVVKAVVRIVTIKELIVYDSDGPYVTLYTVWFTLEKFRGHSHSGAQNGISQVRILEDLGETQIGNLCHTVVQEDVCSFKVSVNCANLM